MPTATELTTKPGRKTVADVIGGDLERIARTLLPFGHPLFEPPEAVSDDVIEFVRGEIRSGSDPLGDALCVLRSQADRRKIGQTLTPSEIVEYMIVSATTEGDFDTIVDPGVGSGRFLRAAARAFPHARLIGVDSDPLSILITAANLEVLGLSHRADLVSGDYRAVSLPLDRGRTLFIGNPPYVRHHDIESIWKDWYAESAAIMGAKRAHKLAGLHLHFFVRTGQLATPGDFGIFVTAAEWMDSSYGEALRAMLRGSLGGISVTNIAADSEPFPGTQATAAITAFAPGRTSDDITFGLASSSKNLGDAIVNTIATNDTRLLEKKWSRLATPETRGKNADHRFIGDVFKVSRGQVTGNNKVFIAGLETPPLPERFLTSCVTGADELFKAADLYGFQLDERIPLKNVITLPDDLSSLEGDDLEKVSAFIEWAKEREAHLSFTAKSRKCWWKVSLHDAPPIIVTYMARRQPVFVRNVAGARLLNIAHGVRPKTSMTSEELDSWIARLNKAATHSSGRIYAGGLIKFEPSDIEDISLST